MPAWEQAVRETTGKDFQLSSIRVPGLTDYQIAVAHFRDGRRAGDGRSAEAHGGAVRGAAALDAAAEAGPRAAERARDSRGAAAAPGRAFVPADGQHARRRAREAHALRPVASTFPTARSPRTRAFAPSIAHARAGARAAQRPGRSTSASSSSATRRTTSSARTRSPRARSRSRPAAIRSKSCRRTIPGACSSELPPPSEFLKLIEAAPA